MVFYRVQQLDFERSLSLTAGLVNSEGKACTELYYVLTADFGITGY